MAGNGDGVVINRDSDYQACHDADVGIAGTYTQEDLFIQYYYCDGDYDLERAFLPFDTSSLPDNAIIESAKLKLYVTDKDSGACIEGDKLCVVQTSQASVTSLSTDDFNEVGDVKGGEISLSSIQPYEYIEIQLNESALNWISKSGWTKIGLRYESDINESAPTDWRCALWISASEWDYPSERPQLIVTYSLPPECTLDVEPSVIPAFKSAHEKTIDTSLELTGKAAKIVRAIIEAISNMEFGFGASFSATNDEILKLSYYFSGVANTESALIDQNILVEPSVSKTYLISKLFSYSPLTIESLLLRLIEGEEMLLPSLSSFLDLHLVELCQFETSIFTKAKYLDVAPWWDESWEYRYPVFIFNNSGLVLEDYEVRVDLSPSNFDYSLCKSDGEDLRFIAPDGTKLPYWIEEWNYGGTSKIWVKAKKIPTGKPLIFYMYCRNPNAQSESSGKDTFLFFEDFEEYNTGALDGQGNWEEEGGTQNFEVATDEVKTGAKAVRVNAEVGITKTLSVPSETGFVLRNYMWGHSSYHRTHTVIQENSEEIAGLFFAGDGHVWFVGKDGWTDSGASYTSNKWYKVEQWISNGITKVFINDIERVHDVSAKTFSNPDKIRLYMTRYESGEGYSRWDQVIVRKWIQGVSYPFLGQATFYSSTIGTLIDVIPCYWRHLKLNNTFLEGGVFDVTTSLEKESAHVLSHETDFEAELISLSPLWKLEHILDSLMIIDLTSVSSQISCEFLPQVQTIILPRLTVVIIG